MNLQTIIFIGRSGCGKGTKVKKLLEFIKENDDREVLHLETGSLFRTFIKEGSYVANLAQKINEVGGLQPEFLSTWAWGSKIISELKPNQHLFADGAPRRLSEAKSLESAFNFLERENVQVIYLNVSKEWATERLQLRGRSDDKDIEDINRRMSWFEKDVLPAIEYYKGNSNITFHDVNGEQEIEKVHQDILNSLKIQD